MKKFLWLIFVCVSLRAATVAELLADGYPVKSGSITPTAGGLWYANGTNFVALPIGSTGQVLKVTAGLPSWGAVAGSGTVTSVDQSFTGGLISVSGNPITSAGTLALTVAGTSGGGVYFSSGSTWASTGALASNACIFGGGAGTAFASQANADASATFLNNGLTAGAGKVGFIFDTTTAMTSTGKVVSFRSAGVEKFTVTRLGIAQAASLGNLAMTGTGTGIAQNRSNGTVVASLGQDGSENGVIKVFDLTGATKVTLDGSNGNVTATTFTGALTGNASGSAATLSPGRSLWGNAFDGSADLTGSISATTGGLSVRDDIVTTTGIVKTVTNFQSTSTSSMMLVSAVTDGAGAIGIKTNTSGALADSTAKLMSFQNNSVEKSYLDLNGKFFGGVAASSMLPTSNDSTALGSATVSWSDLFLASGAVININNGNWVATHTSGILTVGTGEVRITSPGTNSASVITQGSTNTLASKSIDWGSNTITYTSAQARTACSDETGTGAQVFGTSPDFTTSITLGGVAVPTISSTNTVTNKRNQPRITSISSSATPTINTDNCDVVRITALAAAVTSMTSNLSGTPSAMEKLTFEILDDGTARAITWGASFVSGAATLPTTTTVNKILYVGFFWSSARTKWICVAQGSEQ